MKKLVDGVEVAMTQEEIDIENARVKHPPADYRLLRERAYMAAGITFDRLSELRSEIEMFTLEGDDVNAQAKQSELNTLLLAKSDIRVLYPSE